MSQRTNSILPIRGQELLKGSFRGVYEEGRGYMQSSTISVGSHLEIGHMHWSDQCHLDCFKYSSFPGSVSSHFFEANSLNCASLYHGYSLVTM